MVNNPCKSYRLIVTVLCDSVVLGAFYNAGVQGFSESLHIAECVKCQALHVYLCKLHVCVMCNALQFMLSA